MSPEITERARPALPSDNSLAAREGFFDRLLESAYLPPGMADELAYLRDETPGPGYTNEALCHALIERRPEVLKGRNVEQLPLPDVVQVFEAAVLAERAAAELSLR